MTKYAWAILVVSVLQTANAVRSLFSIGNSVVQGVAFGSAVWCWIIFVITISDNKRRADETEIFVMSKKHTTGEPEKHEAGLSVYTHLGTLCNCQCNQCIVRGECICPECECHKVLDG